MQIIPVLDVMNGEVVHASGGERQNYPPLQSQLTDSRHPLQVIDELLDWLDFPQIYLADLDAIEHGQLDQALYQEILKTFPRQQFWIDAGAVNTDSLGMQSNFRRVIGSETLTSGQIEDIDSECDILSLDFRGEKFLGPVALLADTAYWPHRVIVMSLHRVGGLGPDLEKLNVIRQRAPQQLIYAAGGVRNADDLALLADNQIDGVLLATALHHGRLGKALIESYMEPASL